MSSIDKDYPTHYLSYGIGTCMNKCRPVFKSGLHLTVNVSTKDFALFKYSDANAKSRKMHLSKKGRKKIKAFVFPKKSVCN